MRWGGHLSVFLALFCALMAVLNVAEGNWFWVAVMTACIVSNLYWASFFYRSAK